MESFSANEYFPVYISYVQSIAAYGRLDIAEMGVSMIMVFNALATTLQPEFLAPSARRHT